MEQIAIWEALRPRLWMIAAICVVATIAGYGFSFLMTEQYAATALVLVRPQQPIKIDTRKGDKEFLDFPMAQSTAVETPSKTYIEIIKSPELIAKVVRKLDLDKEKEQEGSRIWQFLPAFAYDLKETLKDVPAILKYGRVIKEDPFTKAVKGVEDNLTLTARAETYVFEIKYTAKEAQKAAMVANTTAKSFISLMDEVHASEAQFIGDHLKPHLEQTQRELENARQRLEDYKKAHSVFQYEAEHTAKLKEISDLELELARAEQALVAGQSTLSNVSLAAKRARLVRLLNDRKAELTPLPGLEHDLKQLDDQVKSTANAYQIVEKEFKEAEIKHSYSMPEVRLVSEAVPPRLPSSPVRGTITLACLLGSLVVAVGLAFFLEYLNGKVRSVDDIENFVGVKVLATIPKMSGLYTKSA